MFRPRINKFNSKKLAELQLHSSKSVRVPQSGKRMDREGEINFSERLEVLADHYHEWFSRLTAEE